MSSFGNKDKISWDSFRTKSLIIEYEKYPHLYNQHHELYRNKKTREETLGQIAESLNVAWYGTGVSCTIEDIKKKLNGLRSQYLFERQKISRCATQGETYTPTIYWYPMLKFLEPLTSNYAFRHQADETPQSDGRKYSKKSPNLVQNNIKNELVITPLRECTIFRSQKQIKTDDNASTSSSRSSSPENFIDVQGYLDTEKSSTQVFFADREDPLFIPCTSNQNKNSLDQENSRLSKIEVADHLETFAKFIANELRGIYLSSDDVFLRQTKRRLQQVLIDAWSRIDMDESRYPVSKKLKVYKD